MENIKLEGIIGVGELYNFPITIAQKTDVVEDYNKTINTYSTKMDYFLTNMDGVTKLEILETKGDNIFIKIDIINIKNKTING